jgi:16S rRNA (adenine1518-N6/adenine1519-N6)-dimethyltransferase
MRPRKRYAQHFLEAAWVEKLIQAIAPASSDRFLEIGAGRGALTLALAPRVDRLLAIEIDRALAAGLRRRAPAGVEILEADVLRLDLPALVRRHLCPPGPGVIRVAGNLPYNISSPILRSLLGLHRAVPEVRDATLLLQREIVDRIVAAPGGGDYGPLSIALQLEADVERLLAVPPGAFRPVPKVASALVRLAFREPRVLVGDPDVFHAMVRSMFQQRRKTLLNALRPFAESRGLAPGAALEAAHIASDRRPQTLSLDELARLTAVLAATRSIEGGAAEHQ